MNDLLDNLTITQAKEPTEAELLEEAKAWGFNTVDEWIDAVTKAHDSAKDE